MENLIALNSSELPGFKDAHIAGVLLTATLVSLSLLSVSKPKNYFDVSSGNNGSDADDFSVPGYDLVTGVGSPAAVGLLPALSLK
jgi:hypothetical protein